MIRHRLMETAAGCLLFLAGPVFAEPVAGQVVSPDSAAQGEVWGDPEEQEQTTPGWTWFGMGYERRNRDSNAGVVTTPDPTDPSSGSNGKGGK